MESSRTTVMKALKEEYGQTLKEAYRLCDVHEDILHKGIALSSFASYVAMKIMEAEETKGGE